METLEYVDVMLDHAMLDQIMRGWRLNDESTAVAGEMYQAYVADIITIEQAADANMRCLRSETPEERRLRFEREYAAAASADEQAQLEVAFREEMNSADSKNRNAWKAVHCGARRDATARLATFVQAFCAEFKPHEAKNSLICGTAINASYFAKHRDRADMDYRLGVDVFDLLDSAAAEGEELAWLEAGDPLGVGWLFGDASFDQDLSPKAQAGRGRLREILTDYVNSMTRAVQERQAANCRPVSKDRPMSIRDDEPGFEAAMKERADEWNSMYQPFEAAVERIAELALAQWTPESADLWRTRAREAFCPRLCAVRWPNNLPERLITIADVSLEQRAAVTAMYEEWSQRNERLISECVRIGLKIRREKFLVDYQQTTPVDLAYAGSKLRIHQSNIQFWKSLRSALGPDLAVRVTGFGENGVANYQSESMGPRIDWAALQIVDTDRVYEGQWMLGEVKPAPKENQ